MKITFLILSVLLAIGNLYQCNRKPSTCYYSFIVLDSKNKNEIKPYIISSPPNSTILMNAARGTFFMPTTEPVKISIAAKGYSTYETLLQPNHGGLDVNPPNEVLLNREQ